MAELVGLILMLVALLFVLLPLLTFLRLGRLTRDLDALAARVGRLESRRDPGTAASPLAMPAGTDPAIVARPVPEAVSPPPVGVTPPVVMEPVRDPAGEPVDADLETRIGGRGLLYAGVLILLLGVSFFLKYAFDNAWITETTRVLLGGLAGAGLVAAGLRLGARGFGPFGQALVGTGLAVLYLATYAALHAYALLGRPAAFTIMVLITAVAAVLADRLRAQPVAFIAVGAGFLTPFLVGGDRDAQLTLFSYDALLVGGTLALARRHRWPALNAVSYLMTLLTVAAWADAYYDPNLWLRTLLFLTLFLVLFLLILRETARREGLTTQLVAGLIATAPVFYHLAAIVITAAHPPAVHIYLIVFTAAGLWLTADPHRPWIRLLVLLGGLAPLYGTATLPGGLSWMAPNAVTVVAVAGLHVLALVDRVGRQGQRLALPDLLTLHLTGLGLFSLLAEAIRPAFPGWRGAIAALTAVAALAAWRSLAGRDRTAALHALGLAFALAAIAVAVQFDGRAVVVGWAAQGAAAAWLGTRTGQRPFQVGGLVLWGLAVVRLLDGYFETPAGFVPIVNARALTTAFVVGVAYAIPRAARTVDPRGGLRSGLHVSASVLTLLAITAEIFSYWDVRAAQPQAALYEQTMLSLAWGLYGALLIAIGMGARDPLPRYIGIAVLAATVFKVFFFDLWELGGIYRVVGFLGFGALLVLVSYLYQKRKTAEAVPE